MIFLKQAIILAGGKGSRLSSRLKGLPKPLVDFDGKPLISYQLKILKKYGFEDVLVLVNHKSEKIIDFINSKDWGMDIKCVDDEKPLGTAGAVLAQFDNLANEFLVIYGDTIFDVDLKRFSDFHKKNSFDLTLFVHPNNHPYDSDIVEIDKQSVVKKIHSYPHKPDLITKNLVNAALYIINKDSLASQSRSNISFADFGKDIFPELIKSKIKIGAYNSPEYIKDCGTPERLDLAIKDFKSGKIESSNLNTPQKAIFLDRDGTINEDIDHIKDIDELILLDSSAEAIRLINQSSYRCIVITNQPVVARGECSFENLDMIHNYLETILGKSNAFLDRIYFCPHHPDSGFNGEIKDLKIDCGCRKPKIGMLLTAKNDFNIDFKRSWFIGDTTVDVKTAKNAGIKSILLETGKSGSDMKYSDKEDYKKKDILEAVKFILDQEK